MINFDSIKQTRVRHKEQRKEIVENVVHIPSANTIALGTFKLDLESLPPRLLQNREVHIDYLRNTQEQANILWKIVEQAKAKQPLDGELDLACKYTTRIQELLVYVQDTCLNTITPNTRKVVVTPMNNVKKVRFAEPLTSSSNSKQVESSNTSDSNTRVLSSTRVKCSTRNCRSKPPGNKKNDRISQTPSRNKKKKVEAQPRKVNNSNRVVKPVCDVNVKHSLSNTNSEILCATFNKSMFDGVHDKCLLGNRSQLMKFVSKFLGTVRFGNYQIARIMGYGDYQLGNVIISKDKKLDLSFFHVFGSLCYPTNDHEDMGKFDAKVDIGIFVGYAPIKKAFGIYNRRTQIITETVHVMFDELTAMASK
ncbi:hypothetical protein Tco_1189146 [Tanacetum coccineum]